MYGLNCAKMILWVITLLLVPIFNPESSKTFLQGGTNATMAHYNLVVDGSRVNGQVVLVEYERPDTVGVTQIVNDAVFFNVTEKGHFVYNSRISGWQYGSVTQPGATTQIESVPDSVTYAALSPDNKMVLWTTETGSQSRVLVRSLQTGTEHELISRPGVISVPAWSPQSDAIAFYFVEPNALLNDAFTLNLVVFGDSKPQVKQLVRPSNQTGLTAARTQPPRWSPDGSHILFLANYETENVIRSYAYVVNRDGSGLKRVEGGVWSADGKDLWLARRTELPFGHFVLSKYSLVVQKPIDIDLPFELPKSVAGGRWKPDGQLFAFITNDNELTFIDLTDKRKFKVADFVEGADLIWLELMASQ